MVPMQIMSIPYTFQGTCLHPECDYQGAGLLFAAINL